MFNRIFTIFLILTGFVIYGQQSTIEYGSTYFDDGVVGDVGQWWKPAIVYDFGSSTYYVVSIATAWEGNEENMGWMVTQFGTTTPSLTHLGDLSGTFNCIGGPDWNTVSINSGTAITGKVAFIIETAGNYIYWDKQASNSNGDWNYWSDGWWHYKDWASDGVNAIKVTVSTENPLPVELVNFTGKVIDNEVHLSWTTATELNNYGFKVERNISAEEVESGNVTILNNVKNEKWDVVGFVKGSGDANKPNSYAFTDKNVEKENYIYRLKQIDIDGAFKYSNSVKINLTARPDFKLEQNYPNPFNPSTKLSFSLDKDAFASLIVYNILGEKVKTIVEQNLEKGVYSFILNAGNLASGTYIYTLKAGERTVSRKMNLIK